jgi:hypothetical protein
VRPETEARIRRVQKFGRNGWQFCALAGAMLGIYVVVAWATIAAGPRLTGTSIGVGPFQNVNPELLATASSKIWALSVVTVGAALSAWMLLHLYRLFKQLEAGSIYTNQNVHHLRQVGWVSMALAVLQLILPAVSLGLVRTGFLDSALVAIVAPGPGDGGAAVFLGQSLGGVITASLILLASWIMDVGRQVSDDAEAMRREAELVI